MPHPLRQVIIHTITNNPDSRISLIDLLFAANPKQHELPSRTYKRRFYKTVRGLLSDSMLCYMEDVDDDNRIQLSMNEERMNLLTKIATEIKEA